jgi:hypothetical protein
VFVLALKVKATALDATGVKQTVHPETESEQVTDFDAAVRRVVNSMDNLCKSSRSFDRDYIMHASAQYQITIPAGMSVKVGTIRYKTTVDTVLDITNTYTANEVAGKDVYVYAVESNNTSTEASFVVSLNSTVPSGYTANNSRKIGGFHCLCAAVGTIANHRLTGYTKGAIIPNSVWDLYFRPLADSEGMVFDERMGIWVDIYLASYNGSELVSEYGGVIADGASTPKFHWYKFVDYLARVKKRLPWQHEFMSFSLGSNQSTNIAGSTDPGTTGGHSDTAGRRMVSHIGCEDCCGVMWQWGLDTGSNSASSWSNAYDSNDDGDSLGQEYSNTLRCLLGGLWDGGALCGSRGSGFHNAPLYLRAAYGARGVCASRPGLTG